MTTYYEKRGSRYVAVAESDAWDGIPAGCWLVEVTPGRTSARRLVEPDHAEFHAAARYAEDAMIEAMRARCEMSPDWRRVQVKDVSRYRRAWAAWKREVGDVPLYFEGVSMQDVVTAGIQAVRAARFARGKGGARHHRQGEGMTK